MEVRIHIIEDELGIRKRMITELNHLIIDNVWNHNFSVIEISEIPTFISEISDTVILASDVFLIDIELNAYYNGIDIAKSLREKEENCIIIFFTAWEKKAIDVINQEVFPNAYIIKSVDTDKLTCQLNDILEKVEKLITELFFNSENNILLVDKNRTLYLTYNSIIYISTVAGTKNTLFIKTTEKDYIISGTLKNIKRELPQSLFLLDLKSYIINMSHIRILNPTEEVIVFSNEEELFLNNKIIRKISKKLRNIN